MPEPDCSYFQIAHGFKRGSRTIGEPTESEFIEKPWCAHPKSPVPKSVAKSAGSGRKKLTCKGLLCNCPIEATDS